MAKDNGGGLGVMMASLIFPWAMGCMTVSARSPKGDHHQGGRFRNQASGTGRSVADLVRWGLNRKRGPWRPWTDAEPGPPPPRAVGPGELRVTFINHSTMLIQMDGLNLLTDPIWSDRSSPVSWVGPRRVRPPGIRLEDLPPIHVVLVSHDHYDHLDIPTLTRLHKDHGPRFVVGLGLGRILASHGMAGATELDWWGEGGVGRGVRVTAVPAQHFSSRGVADKDSTLWVGYVIHGQGGRVFFAGDTGFGPHFGQISERFAPFRLALLPIGAYRPRWFMSSMHISPEEAVRAHSMLKARTSVAIHFGTFPLGDDGQDEPIDDLLVALDRMSVPRERFWVLPFGEGRDVPALEEGEEERE